VPVIILQKEMLVIAVAVIIVRNLYMIIIRDSTSFMPLRVITHQRHSVFRFVSEREKLQCSWGQK